MITIICFDVYPSRGANINKMRKVLSKRGFNEKENKYGVFFHAEVPKKEAFHIANVLFCHGYKYKKYDKRWNRSSNYRSEFFKHYNGPYRCAYCGRKLKAGNLEVDHFIPVNKAKTSAMARFVLWMNCIYNVNNYRNLVASCHCCNQAKSDNLGCWVVIGSLGRFYHFWTVFYILLGILFIALAVFIMNITNLGSDILDFIRQSIGQYVYAV